jgi:hypothetical protein
MERRCLGRFRFDLGIHTRLKFRESVRRRYRAGREANGEYPAMTPCGVRFAGTTHKPSRMWPILAFLVCR